MTEKLQKILANAGLASRRQLEAWIINGRVSVNGKMATIGDRATVLDKIRVDGRLVNLSRATPSQAQVLLYYKVAGEICSQAGDPLRPIVFSRLPAIRRGRWIMVGRLDVNTSGLLLFTNNGELANRLMHPRHQIEREYAVRVLGEVDSAMLKRLQQGVVLEDGLAKFEKIRFSGGEGANRWYHVVLKEGRQHEVRRLWQSQGLVVSRLLRVRYGNIQLPRWLRRGKHVMLDNQQIVELTNLVGL